MNILESFFPWLVAASVRAALLALAVLALQVILRRWLPPRWRHALWLPVIFVLVAPQLPASRWSAQNHVTLPETIVRTTLGPITEPNTALAPTVDIDAPSTSPTPVPAASGIRPTIFGIWLAGTCGVIISGMIGYVRSLRRIRRDAVPTDAAITAMAGNAARQLRLHRAPRIVVSPAVVSPAVAGLFRPLLLLPADFAASFSPAEARLILLHELTHLKRGDLPLNWLLCLLQALHWFNPVLWLAFARMRSDREMACDAQVLGAEATDLRGDYGHALLKLQSATHHRGLSLAFVGLFERQAGLRTRIRAIAEYRRPHRGWAMAAAAVVILLVAVGATRAQVSPPAIDSLSFPFVAQPAPSLEIAPLMAAAAKTEPAKAPPEEAPPRAEDAAPVKAPEMKPEIPEIEITAYFAEFTGVKPAMWEALRSAGTWTDLRGKQEWSRLIVSSNPAQQQALLNKWAAALSVSNFDGSSMATPATIPVRKSAEFMPLVIRLLQQKKGVDVLTAPKVTARSQQDAKIEIIREFRYATAWEPGKKKTDKWTPTKFAVKNTGVTLSAKPTMTEDGRINLWFEPVVTEFEGFTDLGQGRQKPNFTERRAQTSVTLRDGQTVILGGAVREDSQKVEDKVPMLGDIPLLGGAFRSTTIQKIQRRLVVFVTPRIVEKKSTPPASPAARPAGVSSPANTWVVPPLRDRGL